MGLELKYAKSVVAFLDVLGFRKLLRNKSETEKYFDAVIDGIGDLQKKDLKAILVSDSVVLKIPHESAQSVRDMLIAVARIQAQMAVKDIWLRGGVSIGDIDFKMVKGFQVVAGEALARAYEMESLYARYPRVMLDPAIKEVLGLNRVQFLKTIYNDNADFRQPVCDLLSPEDEKAFIPGVPVVADGLWVDYAFPILESKERILEVSKNLRRRLYEGQEHYEKYRWVQGYFWTTFEQPYFKKKHGDEYETLLKVIGNL